MHKKGDTFVFTGTTKDKELASRIEDVLEADDDLNEARLVRNAVREYLDE